MINIHFIHIPPQHVATEYLKLDTLTRKIPRTVSNIGFAQSSIRSVVSLFTKLKGQFINAKNKSQAEKDHCHSLSCRKKLRSMYHPQELLQQDRSSWFIYLQNM